MHENAETLHENAELCVKMPLHCRNFIRIPLKFFWGRGRFVHFKYADEMPAVPGF